MRRTLKPLSRLSRCARLVSRRDIAVSTALKSFTPYEDHSVKIFNLQEALVPPNRAGFVLPTYQVMDEQGKITNPNEMPTDLSEGEIISLFEGMVQIGVMDKILYDIQRQGLISFYMTSFGEEAYALDNFRLLLEELSDSTHFGSAKALTLDDVVYAQYREVGVIYHRGLSVQDLVHQCFSNNKDLGKGRQMPVHYGSRAHNFQTISSPLGTQIPQASGAAYALKLQGKPNCVICYFGDGAASEGDFHAALNFASTLDCPVIFFCRNNKWAISTPSTEQYRGDGIGGRGIAYGMHTIRVDGNDVFAVYNATKVAKRIAVSEHRPVLIEAMTYRVGHHSTSDDYSRYRSQNEVNVWTQGNNPTTRLFKYLENHGLYTQEKLEAYRKQAHETVMTALKTAEKEPKPHIDHLFTDVYDKMTPRLEEQKQELSEHLKQFGSEYHLDQYSKDF